jgi:hypothetical protein
VTSGNETDGLGRQSIIATLYVFRSADSLPAGAGL